MTNPVQISPFPSQGDSGWAAAAAPPSAGKRTNDEIFAELPIGLRDKLLKQPRVKQTPKKILDGLLADHRSWTKDWAKIAGFRLI